MKAIKKEFYMEIRKTKSRFLSIMLIVALGVAFYAGVCSAEPDMRLSADKFYDDGNLMDIRVVSTTGITDEIIDDIEKINGVEKVKGAFVGDFVNIIDGKESVISLQSHTEGINEPILSQGRLPDGTEECIVEASYAESYGLKVGDVIELSSGTELPIEASLKRNQFEITGICTTPYYIGMERGTTTIGNGQINGILMVDEDVFNQPVYSSCYVIVKGAKEERAYSDSYQEMVDRVSEAIEEYTKSRDEVFYVLDRSSIQTYMEFDQDAERIGNIGKVVPMVFFIVAALVSLTTMTRMVEEQRTQIGTLKALGYKKSEVAGKYIKYALYATVTGSIIGGAAGSLILPRVIINAYKMMYALDTIVTPIDGFYFLFGCGLAIVLVIAATIFSCYRELMECPAGLMRPEPPKKTKKVFLERFPFIWGRIKFSSKSTIRNLVRYKKRLFMTLFGISGCMSLLVVGFGLKDSINSVISIQYDELHTYDMVLSLETGLDLNQVDTIRENIDDNENVEGSLFIKNSAITIKKQDVSLSGSIYIMDKEDGIWDFIKLRDRNSEKSYSLSDEGVMVSEKAAGKLGVEKGDTIDIEISDTERYTVKVWEIVENYVYDNIYITKALYEKLIGQVEYNQILVRLTDDGKVIEEEVVEDILKWDGISGASYIDRMRDKFDEMLGSLDIITVVIVIAAGGLAFIVLYNLNNININERRRELATLKVLGFYDLEVSQYIYRENVIITAVGIIIGAFLGIILHKFVITTAEVDAVMFGRDVDILSFVWSGLITVMFAVIINLSMHRKLKTVDMATSLKSVE